MRTHRLLPLIRQVKHQTNVTSGTERNLERRANDWGPFWGGCVACCTYWIDSFFLGYVPFLNLRLLSLKLSEHTATWGILRQILLHIWPAVFWIFFFFFCSFYFYFIIFYFFQLNEVEPLVSMWQRHTVPPPVVRKCWQQSGWEGHSNWFLVSRDSTTAKPSTLHMIIIKSEPFPCWFKTMGNHPRVRITRTFLTKNLNIKSGGMLFCGHEFCGK